MVLSQDCDLEQDFKERQKENGGIVLPNVLLCDVFHADVLRAKVRDEENLASREWRVLRQNKNERFQFLNRIAAGEDLKNEGLPPLAIDFRLYFSIRTDEVYRRIGHGTSRRCRLATPYVEQIADRFSHYLARVAL